MKKYLNFIILIIFTSNVNLFAQQLTALEVLKKATEVAGGETWHNPKTLLLKGDADFTPYGLADEKNAIHFDKYVMHRVFPPYNDDAHKMNGRVRFDAVYKDSTFFLLNFDGKKQTLNLSERAKPYAKQFNLAIILGSVLFVLPINQSFKPRFWAMIMWMVFPVI